MGYGWAHNYDKRLYVYSSSGSAIIRQGNGRKQRYQAQSNDLFYFIIPPPPQKDGCPIHQTGWYLPYVFPNQSFSLLSDGGSVYKELDGSQETYDISGRLTKITGLKGNSLTFSYDPDKASLLGVLPTN